MTGATVSLSDVPSTEEAAARARASEPVRSSEVAGAPSRFLVCPPDHFDTHYLFNPFMGYREKVSRRRARAQWRRLVRALEDAGAEVEAMEPSPLSSALPFTADGALCYAPGRAVILRNDGPRGNLEPPLFGSWLREHGYEVESLPPTLRLDGGNLVTLASGDLLVGRKPGADGRAERYLSKLLDLVTGAKVWAVPLVDERHLHLDTAVAPLGDRACLIRREALGDPLPAPLLSEGMEPIEVGGEDAARFACNLVVVGEVVITGLISDSLARKVRALGFEVERLDLGEFHKAGGGARCLTLGLAPAAQPSKGGS